MKDWSADSGVFPPIHQVHFEYSNQGPRLVLSGAVTFLPKLTHALPVVLHPQSHLWLRYFCLLLSNHVYLISITSQLEVLVKQCKRNAFDEGIRPKMT